MNMQAVTEVPIIGSPGPGPRTEGPESRPARPVAEAPSITPQQPAPNAMPAPEELARALEGMNGFLASGNNHIQFAVHQEAERLMVQIIDDETQEVIRTIPSKELLDLAARIGEMVGMLLDKRT